MGQPMKPSPSPQARGVNTPNAQDRPDMDKASNHYSASAQSRQFSGGDNRHAGSRAGTLRAGKDTPGPEEIPFEDDRPQRFPERDTTH